MSRPVSREAQCCWCLVNIKNVAAILWVLCVNCLGVRFIVAPPCVKSSVLLYCTVQYTDIALCNIDIALDVVLLTI